jgi:hypothetical protein
MKKLLFSYGFCCTLRQAGIKEIGFLLSFFITGVGRWFDNFFSFNIGGFGDF